ncbi:MAG: DUF3445 domain-containing protein [Silicimonas sp.]|nr:DUF3445 domain-containing protein [Silicimonas sp.]
MTDVVLHDSLPFAPWLAPASWRLPGVQPLEAGDWLIRDEAFAGQMQIRDRLIAETPDLVHALTDDARGAAGECLDRVLNALGRDQGYQFTGQTATRPDGVQVPLDRANPLMTVGRLMQADVCLMTPGPKGHVLGGAILCFPSNWTLAEKLGRPMTRIHRPVARYDEDIARRVQRLFDAMRVEQPLWRANAILHHSPKLFAPRREAEPRDGIGATDPEYLRSERQTLLKLPGTQAIVFTIHTIVVPISRLTDVQRNGLAASGIELG